MLNISMIE